MNSPVLEATPETLATGPCHGFGPLCPGAAAGSDLHGEVVAAQVDDGAVDLGAASPCRSIPSLPLGETLGLGWERR